MKKIFTFLLAVASIQFASAQSYSDHQRANDDRPVKQQDYRSGQAKDYDNHNYRYDHQSRDHRNVNDRNYQAQQYRNENDRQYQITCINQEYERKVSSYRDDRKMSGSERRRQIRFAESARDQQLKAFGSGAIVGAVAGLVIGNLLSR